MSRFDFIQPGARGESPSRRETLEEPQDAAGFRRAARDMRRMANFEAAARLYERALGLDEHHHGAWAEMVDTLVRAGRVKQAEKRAQEAIANYGQVRVFYAAEGLALAHLDKPDEALGYCQVSLEGEERDWRALCAVAECTLRADRGALEVCAGFWEEALTRTNQAWEVYFTAGMALLDARRPAHAAAYFAEAAHEDPRAVAGWIGLGDAFRMLRLYDQAAFYYRQGEELDPYNRRLRKQRMNAAKRAFGLMQALPLRPLEARWRQRWDKHNG
jgi:tetratricopeptide (TPR) repeat protein